MGIKFVSILFLLFIVNQAFGSDVAPKLPCSCRVSAANRIIKGRIAGSQTYPWLVSIQLKDLENPVQAHGCGASVLNSVCDLKD